MKFKFEKAYGGSQILTRNEVKEYLEYLLGLKSHAEDLLRDGRSIEEIVKTIFSRIPQKVLLIEEWSGGEWSRRKFIFPLLARPLARGYARGGGGW